MKHPERKEARRYDMPGRCRKFTDMVYSGPHPDSKALLKQVFAVEEEFYPTKPEYNIYFGEMHGHTDMSDGHVSMDHYFTNIRDNAKLDFAAITDHDHGGVGNAELWAPEKWKAIQSKVREYYQPGKFTTILAYERDSYPWYNNLVIYFGHHDGEIVRGEHDGDITRKELEYFLHREDVLLIPHDTYSLSAGCDFLSIPVELMPTLMEIYSRGDAAEYFNHPMLARNGCCEGGTWQDALKRGARMGVIAGSDDHCGLNGFANTDYGYGPLGKFPGITGVWAEQNTVESIFSALKARRCYGFTGGRMKLDFRINGHYMGEEFSLPKDEDRTVWFDFEADAPVDSVTLVKNCRDYILLKDQARQVIFDYRAEQETDCYYIRAITKDGRWCWSSPIWVTGLES